MRVNLFGDTGTSWNNSISASECVNMTVDFSAEKETAIFRKMPGTKLFYSTNNSSDRILGVFIVPQTFSFQARIYFLLRSLGLTSLKSMDENGVIRNVGAVPFVFNTRVLWAEGKREDNGKLLIAMASETKTIVVNMRFDPSLDTLSINDLNNNQQINGLSYLDGFFFISTLANRVYSTILGGVDFDTSRFAVIESNSGVLVGHFTDNRELWVMSSQNTSIWYNAANSGFPLLRNSSANIKVGLYSVGSLVKFGDFSIFLGEKEGGGVAVYRTSGYTLIDITPKKLKSQLSKLDKNLIFAKNSLGRKLLISDTELYILNFNKPEVGTWVYRLSSGMWSKESSSPDEMSKYAYDSYGIIDMAAKGNEQLNLVIPASSIGSSGQVVSSNEIHSYEMWLNVEATVSGQPLTKLVSMTSRYIEGADEKQLIHRYLKLKFTLIALITPVMVEVARSDDEGKTWEEMGAFDIRQNSGLLEFYALGASIKRLYRITSDYSFGSTTRDNTTICLTDAYIDTEQLSV